MQETILINTIEQLRAFSHPLRQRIIKVLCCQPATTKQTADQLGEKPSRLYHHMTLLEEAGLIEMIKTRQIRGTVEKYYQTAAKKFVIDHALLGNIVEEGQGPLNASQTILINALQTSLVDARSHFAGDVAFPKNGQKLMILAQGNLRLSKEQASELIDKLTSVLEGCQAEETEKEGQDFSLTVALFPVKEASSDSSPQDSI